MYINGAYRFPLFFIEFITNLIGFLLIGVLMKFFDVFKSGTHAALYFV
jgi:prolipoprotein diacylglyceryltransferase